MSPDHQSTAAPTPDHNLPSTPRRLTLRQTAAKLGINVGDLIKLRSKGARSFDPTFPPISEGTFNEDEVLAWQKSRADRATHA